MYKEHVQDLLFLHIWPFFEMYQMQEIIFDLPPIGDSFRLYAIVCFTHCPEDPTHSKTTLIQSTELRVNSTLTFKEKLTQIKNLKRRIDTCNVIQVAIIGRHLCLVEITKHTVI